MMVADRQWNPQGKHIAFDARQRLPPRVGGGD